MYRITQLMSTPVASKCPCKSDRQSVGELSPRSSFPSFSCDFLDGESSFECCSIDPLSGSHYICRRSPRLLTNGYYIWTEDSFCCDNDGHVTLSPSRTSVVYKENLVRIFRKKRKIRHSLSPLFDLGASESWLHESVFDSDSSRREEKWLEGIRSLETYDCNQNGDDFDFSSLTDDWESEKLTAETVIGCSSSHTVSQPPRGISQEVGHQSQWPASAHFQDSPLAHSKSSSLRVVSFQAIVFAACLIMSAFARCFMGGILAGVLAGSVVITLTYVIKPLLLGLAGSFRAATCTWSHRVLTDVAQHNSKNY